MLRRYMLLVIPALALATTIGSTAVAEQAGNMTTAMPAMQDHERTADRIADKVATARTAADHEAIAEYFDAEATRLEAQVALHTKLAQTYRTGGAAKGARGGTMAKHCERLVKEYTDAARTQREMAAMHREMATAADR